jgi:hypothetical protein
MLDKGWEWLNGLTGCGWLCDVKGETIENRGRVVLVTDGGETERPEGSSDGPDRERSLAGAVGIICGTAPNDLALGGTPC